MKDIREAKKHARELARFTREAHESREQSSVQIAKRLLRLEEVRNASHVCCFVSFSSEVQTPPLITSFLAMGKTVAVPWCSGDDLRLCKIHSLDELEPGKWGILEPPESMQTNLARRSELFESQIVIVPGLAFTSDGKRLGYGRGYYDRLLRKSESTTRIALAFDCQMAADLPTTEDDVTMDMIVTESGTTYVVA